MVEISSPALATVVSAFASSAIAIHTKTGSSSFANDHLFDFPLNIPHDADSQDLCFTVQVPICST
ncbi:hypothetical protein BUE80_DR010950 [Diplocarpon rosae]|nr:hypothetical protein BUE80_DR010950 [Diplocarpon rosae]